MRPPRSVLVASYLVFALAGAFFMFLGPNTGLQDLLGWFGVILWNTFLVLGGSVGAIGAWTRKFRVEIIASPLLVAGLAVYGGYMFSRIAQSRQPGVLAGLGSIFIGSAMLFLGKGLAIWIHKIQVADAVDQRSDDAE